jgi:hypothetical protein
MTFASVLARREMFEEIGLLYEGFFMYYDDSDLCLRMQKTRWKIVMAEDHCGVAQGGRQHDYRREAVHDEDRDFIQSSINSATLEGCIPRYTAQRSPSVRKSFDVSGKVSGRFGRARASL